MASKALKGLTIKIGGDTSELTKSLDKVDKQGRSLSSELGQINKLLKLDPTNTELLAQKQKVLADAISNTEDKLDTLKEAEKQVQKQFERGEVSEAQYRALQREIIETEGKLDKYKNAAKETADAEKKLADGADKAADELDDAGKASEGAGLKFDGAVAAAAALTAGFVALGKASVDAFNEVDEGADNVIKATGATGAVAADLTESYKKVATQVVGSLDAIGATVGEVNTRFGYTGEQLEATSADFMKFAEITGVDSTEAVKSVTRALNDSGTPLSEYKNLLDLLAKAGQSAGIDVTKLSEGLSTNGATMRAMGLDTAESVALLAQFELSGADATTMLSGMKKAMATWAKEGKDSGQEFEKMLAGIKNGTVTAGDALEVFGSKAGPQLVDAIQSGKFEYNDLLKVLRKSGGTLEDTFGELEDGGYSVQRSFQRLKVMSSDLGEEIMEATAPALEDLLDYFEREGVIKKFAKVISKDIIPGIRNVSSWVKSNGPLIKSTIAGVTTAIVAYKTATVAAEVAQKGLKGAILATAAAEKALQLVQAATPWGLVATAVAGVTTALIAYSLAAGDAQKEADVLTAEERELMAAADEAAAAFRDQKKATNEALGDITAEMNHTQQLADELRSLADASGKVKESDQQRAQFILNELNEALGTEYEMVNGVIQNYKDLKKSIDEVIKSKTANSLIEAANADYVAAIQNEAEALENLNLKEKDYQQQLGITQQKEKEYQEARAVWQQAMESGDQYAIEAANLRMMEALGAWEKEKGILTDKKSKYDQAAQDYSSYYNTISTYEEAQTAALSGNYEKAVDLLSKKGGAYRTYSDKVDTETAKVLDTLYKEAIDAGLEAERTKKNFENGVDGYTKGMVTEAEKNYKKAMGKFANAYADAESVGEDLSEGMTAGAENKRSGLLAKARSLVSGFLEAARKAADSHSPSRKAIAIFEDIGEGAEIGVENKTPDVAKAGADQASALLDAYRAQEVNAQRALRGVAEQQAHQTAAGQLSLASANAPMLEKILAAIEAGQVIALDGDLLVGGTADRMDRKLGQIRLLTARGAK